MDFFDELSHEEPKGICLHEYPSEILEFVRSHFGRLLMARSKGYSWRQIARAVEARTHFLSKVKRRIKMFLDDMFKFILASGIFFVWGIIIGHFWR